MATSRHDSRRAGSAARHHPAARQLGFAFRARHSAHLSAHLSLKSSSDVGPDTENAEETVFADQTLRDLPAPFRLASQIGKGLDGCPLSLGALSATKQPIDDLIGPIDRAAGHRNLTDELRPKSASPADNW